MSAVKKTTTHRPRGVPAGAALLAGRLRVGPGPTLVIDCWCPACHTTHQHGWPSAQLTGAEHRVAHCHGPDSPYRHGGYHITPAGPWAKENRETLATFAKLNHGNRIAPEGN